MPNYFYIKLKHLSYTSTGRWELWLPSNISMCFIPGNDSYIFWECEWCIILSYVPAIINSLRSLFRGFDPITSATSNSLISNPAFYSTSDLTHENKQGYKQWKQQQHTFGVKFKLDYSHRSCKDEKGESAIRISHYWLKSRLTDPILRPHPTTLYPFCFKKAAAISTYFDSLLPKVMNWESNRIPHALKSKQASPTPSGSSFKCI